MRFSQLYVPTIKETPRDAEVVSHQLMLRAGMIRKVASGIYTLLPLGLRSIRKFEAIIREEMDAINAQEIMMPMVIPSKLWQETGRWNLYGKELLRLEDRHDNVFCLGPTHEEVVTDLVRDELKSYKQLPLTLYQIQTKFRDEIRPRFGLMRCREFGMKDAYSFHANKDCLDQMYLTMAKAYQNIFTRCKLSFRCVNADNGSMGGSASTEFMVTAQTGEDEIYECRKCGFAGNQEILTAASCPECPSRLNKIRGIEVGHIFKLGDTYTKSMAASVLNKLGNQIEMTMGCYGIGIGRTIAAAIEQNHDEKGIKWPIALAPYTVNIIITSIKNTSLIQYANKFFDQLTQQGVDTIIDDRDDSIGVKFKDSELIGFPFQVVFGKLWVQEERIEVIDRITGEKFILSFLEAIKMLCQFKK